MNRDGDVISPVRRGIPEFAPWTQPLPDFDDRLEHALTSGAAVLVEAPAGAGKTTALARWSAEHPRRGAVWIAPGPRVRSWDDVLARLAAAIDFEPWLGERGALAEHVRHVGPLVLVVDRADEFAEPLDARAVIADLDAVPSLAVVFATRSAPPGLTLLGPSRVQALPAELLAMTPEATRRLLDAYGIDMPATVLAQVLAATGGLPAAVLDVATRWAEERRRVLPTERQSVARLAALALAGRVEAVAGSAGRTALLLVASLLEAPAPLLDVLLPTVGVDPAIVRVLAAEGHLSERTSVFSGRPAWAAAPVVQAELAELADDELPELVVVAHRAAAESPHCRELEPFHRARSRAPRQAAELVLRRWRGDQVPGGPALTAVLRSLPDDVLAEEPVLAALRVALAAFERSRLGTAELRGPEDRVLHIAAEKLAALDLNDRLLVEAAAAEVLMRRGLLGAALHRVLPFVEGADEQLASLDARGRRAYSYLLVVAAEIHITQLIPHRAMPLAMRVLSLDGADRWSITKYRASVVAAFCHFFAADRARMTAALEQADLYFALGGFGPGPVQAHHWLTELADAARCGDVAGLDRVLASFAGLSDDPVAGVIAEMLRGMRALLTRDVVEAEATLARLVAAPDFGAYPPAVRALALRLGADAALAGRRAGAALDLLAGAVPPPGHAVCFDAVRAMAHLALGQPQTALDTTAGCVAMGPRHSVDALASVLIARSLAHLALRHPESARAELVRGVHLLPPEWHRSALAALPGSTLLALADLLDDEHADLQALLWELGSQDDGTMSVAPTLSKKEFKLLLLLQEGLALAEIADRLFVSINTVKTQCRSLYRKLGVSSRHEAVDLAFVRGTGPR